MARKNADSHAKAIQVLTALQKSLLKRLGDHVLENEGSLRQAAEGAEGYGYSLHQLDEVFLSRLNLIERTMAELHKTPVSGGNRYRSMVFTAPRDQVEQAINARLEKVPSARILGVTVSPSSTSARVAHQFPEIEPSGEQPSPGRPQANADGPVGSTATAGRPRPAGPATGLGAEGASAGEAVPGRGGPEAKGDDELLVTVLYYGPAVAADV